MSELEWRAKCVIIDELGVDENEVTLDARFAEDLRADPQDAVELIMALEEAFGIEIFDQDAERLTSLRIVVEYLKRRGASG